MDLQFSNPTSTQSQFVALFTKNEQLLKKRAQNLFRKIQAIMTDTGQADLLNNIHLSSATKYFQQFAQMKRNEANLVNQAEEQQIDRQIKEELIKQNDSLMALIQGLKNEIKQIEQKRAQYSLSQKITQKSIQSLEQKILKQKLNPKLLSGPTQLSSNMLNPLLEFAYQITADGSVIFKQSYKKIIKHYFDRMNENERSVGKLNKMYKQRVKETEIKRVKMEVYKKQQNQMRQMRENIRRLKQRLRLSKNQCREQLHRIEEQIQNRLPQQIDRSVKSSRAQKASFQKVFHSLLGLVSRVTNQANLDKINDYINIGQP